MESPVGSGGREGVGCRGTSPALLEPPQDEKAHHLGTVEAALKAAAGALQSRDRSGYGSGFRVYDLGFRV